MPRADFGPASDIDVGILMELELESVLGHEVQLRTYQELSRFFRDEVAASARSVYAAWS